MTIILASVVILLLMSAFFSGSETGLTAASRAKIHKLKVEGNKRAEMVSQLRQDKDRLIGAILLGNNAVNIGASALATTVAIEYFGNEGVLYVTIIMTLLVLIFAEVLPKTYAFRHAEHVALAVAPIFIVLVRVLSPITVAVQYIVHAAMIVFGLTKGDEDIDIQGTDALRGAIELHHDEGAVIKDDRDMLGSILDLEDVEVRDIMIHRKNMETLDITLSNAEAVARMMDSRFTRIPFWQDNPDNIIGTLHTKNLLRALQEYHGDSSPIDIRSMLQEPWFIPDTTNLKDQLRAFREEHNHMAFVVDEYGDLMGMITLEDILEEIVGQIDDEHDDKTKLIRPGKQGSYVVDGRMTIRDLNRELNWSLPDEEAATIAGLVIHEAQLIPEAGQVFQFHDIRFEILRRQRNQLTSLRLTPSSPPSEFDI